MKKFTILLLAGLLVLAPALFSDEEKKQRKHPDQAMLWKVEGKGLEKPSWLFGTIHIGEGPIATLHPAAEKAYAGSDTVFTEIPMDSATQLGLATHFIRKDGKTLTDAIGEELVKALETELKAVNPALTATPFQQFKTWTVAVTIPLLEMQLKGSKALDQILWDKATADGKTTNSLEKPEDQFGIFDDLTEEEQVVFLAESIRGMKEARDNNDNPTQALINAYITGDPIKLEAEMEKLISELAEGEYKELGEKLLKRLFDDRNHNMTKAIVAELNKTPAQSHFFAVGAGHYIGKENIGELLTKQGYKVSRVSE